MKKYLLALAPSFLLAAASAQSTIYVPDDYATIQAAIDASVNGDTIVARPGTYAELVSFNGKAITLQSELGPQATTITGGGTSGPVIAFWQGESNSSVLSGFTITGGSVSGIVWGAGISCFDSSTGLEASPTIRGCVVTDNDGANNAFGAGIGGGAPTIEDCAISSNAASGSEGGGVWGAPRISRCRIEGNSAYDAGGIFVGGTGCVIEDSVIAYNFADEGARGGGIQVGGGSAIAADTVIRRCLVYRNTVDGLGGLYTGTGGGIHVAPIGSSNTTIESCTIADNVSSDNPFGDDYGGAYGAGAYHDCILWGNSQIDLDSTHAATATYCDVDGGFAGAGNLALDPLFFDAANDDYFLTPSSPCVDAGDPASPLDPDGTRADMGALTFPQFPASATSRNGSGVNAPCLFSLQPPVIGSMWLASVNTFLHQSSAATSVLIAVERPLTGIGIGIGEVLIDPTSVVYLTDPTVIMVGLGVHSVQIPLDYSLGGFPVYTQAVLFGSPLDLTNALDLVLGLYLDPAVRQTEAE
jgi:hypothetical protein